jgi:dTDP-4-dehydrorhamnose reductase
MRLSSHSEAVLRQTRERYPLPVAVTEVNNGCTAEEQLRWLDDVWRAASAIDAEAVTVWSSLGSFGWNTLVSGGADYDPGVYDVHSAPPRATALRRMVADLAAGRPHPHPVLASAGWWRRRGRPTGPPLLISGASGTLGQALAHASGTRDLAHWLLSRQELDIADPTSVAGALAEHAPWAVVNAAGYVRVDEAECDTARCYRENRDSPGSSPKRARRPRFRS